MSVVQGVGFDGIYALIVKVSTCTSLVARISKSVIFIWRAAQTPDDSFQFIIIELKMWSEM